MGQELLFARVEMILLLCCLSLKHRILFKRYLNHNLFPLSVKFRLSSAVTLTGKLKLVCYLDIADMG